LNLFVKNISQLVTVAAGGRLAKTGTEMRDIGVIPDAGVYCREGKIVWAGPMSESPDVVADDISELDAAGCCVFPGFVDSHTHALFAGDRVDEFSHRAAGATYTEIAEQGGGIVSTMNRVRAADKRSLKRQTARFLTDMMRHGTTTVEIKSGYGLALESEIKMLEAINELRKEEIIGIVPTLLGAHAIPPEYKDNPRVYVDLVVNELIPYVGKKKLATFCDVFCENGYFGLEETERILAAGKTWGLQPKIHADELTPLGGAELAGRIGAISADHLEKISSTGIAALRAGNVVAGILPGVSFFLNHGYAPARALIDAGIAVAIATDFNPGSCMSFSIPLMMTIACTQMQLAPEEAISAVTLNGAASIGQSRSIGSIEAGKDADLIIAEIPDYRYLAYHCGMNHVRTVVKHGTILEM
jgi:imidazolonepropionase